MQRDLLTILQRPGNLVLPSNQAFRAAESSGAHAVRTSTGHLVYSGPHGRRILLTDPDGHPLHECEWAGGPSGEARLACARLCLDWGQWVGLKPGGIVRETALDVSTRPGWEGLKADDLRQLAAQALRVPLEEVRFFYPDEDLRIAPDGRATIRHRKDAFYVLEDGTFEKTRFMACLGAMHWERIDFLPVVELFQSLLPGTGSAAFELVRGLYDDQNPEDPRPLRYRGIPTYPSEAAYRLFSAFFTPSLPGGGDPFPVFMDQSRSHEVIWLPRADPPRRYLDRDHRLCVTVAGETVQKVTPADDPAGLPYVQPSASGFVPCDRQVAVVESRLELWEGGRCNRIPARPQWGSLRACPPRQTGPFALQWRQLLGPAFPTVPPAAAYAAVLLYPEDDAEIDEASCQVFAADYLQDGFEQDPGLRACLGRAERVLIDNLDAALASCLPLDRPRLVTVLYERPAYVQKFAQGLWNRLAPRGRLDWAQQVRFLPAHESRSALYRERHDLVLAWVPFAQHSQHDRLATFARSLGGALSPGGLAGVVGPPGLLAALRSVPLRVVHEARVEDLPPYRMHLSLLPQARLRAGLTLYIALASS